MRFVSSPPQAMGISGSHGGTSSSRGGRCSSCLTAAAISAVVSGVVTALLTAVAIMLAWRRSNFRRVRCERSSLSPALLCARAGHPSFASSNAWRPVTQFFFAARGILIAICSSQNASQVGGAPRHARLAPPRPGRPRAVPLHGHGLQREQLQRPPPAARGGRRRRPDGRCAPQRPERRIWTLYGLRTR